MVLPISEGPSRVERLLLDEAATAVPEPRHPAALDLRHPATGAEIAARDADGAVRVWHDSLRTELAWRAADPIGVRSGPAYGGELLGGANLVLTTAPRSLDALAERASAVAHLAAPDVTLLVGGRNQDLNRGMNAVLERHFGSVRASLGRDKCRVLIASSPRPGPVVEPQRRHHDDLDLTVVAHGGVFAGTGVDLGTRALLTALADVDLAPFVRIADLGCGSGILATMLARRHPPAEVIAVDDSAVACWSTAATIVANPGAERAAVRRADLLTGVPDASLDLVVCNPPFHRGPTKDSTDAFAMITDAARALRPGGELWTVYNAHLPYLPALQRAVGPTRIARRTRSFLVTRSVRR